MARTPHPLGESDSSADENPPTPGWGCVSVIIVAAGASNRMGGVDKIFAPILGTPLIAYTVDVFESSPLVKGMLLVLSPEMVHEGQELASKRGWRKLWGVSAGGQRRQDSVRLGLEGLPAGNDRFVAVHDGARPCVTPDILARGVEAAQLTGAAVAAVPAKDTVKMVSSDGTIEETPSRDKVWQVQTPQIFTRHLLERAHRECTETVTDDGAMVEMLGHTVRVFMGSYENIKITTPEDLAIAELLLHRRNPEKGT